MEIYSLLGQEMALVPSWWDSQDLPLHSNSNWAPMLPITLTL